MLCGALVACSASEPQETESAEGNTTIGGRWRSPFEHGAFDERTGGGTLALYGDLDAQEAILSMWKNRIGDVCRGRLDVQGEGAKLEGDGCSSS